MQAARTLGFCDGDAGRAKPAWACPVHAYAVALIKVLLGSRHDLDFGC